MAHLSDVPSPIRRRVLRLWAEEACGGRLQRTQLEALERLASRETPTARVALPGGIAATVELGVMRTVAVREARTDSWQAPFCEGDCRIAELGATISVLRAEQIEPTKINNLSTVLHTNIDADSAIIKKAFYWRTYRDGDVVLTHGMHKKLRRIYREAGIPPRLRRQIPLLCDAAGIVWAPFGAHRDAAQGERGTPFTIRVTLDGVADELPLKTKDV